MIDKNLMNCKLTMADKELLYKLLYEDSDISDRMTACREKMGEYVRQAYRSTLDKDMLLLFEDSKRIAKRGVSVRLDTDCFGLGDKSNFYPNDLWPRDGHDSEKHSTVSGYYSVTLREEMPVDLNGTYVTGELIGRLSDKWKEILKNTYIELKELEYEAENFMCDYVTIERGWYTNKKYFPNISSWGQLEREHPEWFNILFESRKSRLIQDNIISEEPESNETKLTRLKEVLGI